jgi:hypothetical protein
MSTVSWLHLSDWHQKGADFDRKAVRDALLEDLRFRNKISPSLGLVDFVVFSGDLAFSGKDSEYQIAQREFLEPVLNAVGVTKDRLFLVPGNHDLDRLGLPLVAPLGNLFHERRKVSEELSNPDHRKVLFSPMQSYARFVHSFLGSRRLPEPTFGHVSCFEVRGRRIAILGMNSAWMCGQRIENGEVDDYGALILGEPQFHDALQSPEVSGADLVIAVMHHPFNWLSDIEGRRFVERCVTRGVHFILRGHEHESQVSIPSGTSGSCAIVSAGACYDRREYANGYNFVLVDFASGLGTVFLRRYDLAAGFQNDTVTTGDETPGYHQFPLPSKTTKPMRQFEAGETVEVKLVVDHRDPDLVEALDIYEERIPAAERFEAPDVIRWLREDQEQRKLNATGPWDYCFIAKTRHRVCGLALMHYYPKLQLAFMAYLVVEKGVPVGSGTVSHKLLDSISNLLAKDKHLRECKGFVFEVDDPVLAASDDERRERLARIRLFSMLAQANGLTLRGLDFGYRQPPLSLSKGRRKPKQVSMLLMFGPRVSHSQNWMTKREVAKLLKFIFEWLYPEGFSEVPEETAKYRNYLSRLCSTEIARLPTRIALLSFAQIRTRDKRPR